MELEVELGFRPSIGRVTAIAVPRKVSDPGMKQ